MRKPGFWLLLSILFTGPLSTLAEDATLAELHDVLVPMRAKPLELTGPRGATQPLTVVKHKLLAWIETRLHEFHNRDEVSALEHKLNAELRAAKLSCDWNAFPRDTDCPDRGEPGYLRDIRLHFGEVLIVTTEVGVVCGFDQSAYAYSFTGGHWQRFWQSETNQYIEGKYFPLNFLNIRLSLRDYRRGADPNLRLLLVLARARLIVSPTGGTFTTACGNFASTGRRKSCCSPEPRKHFWLPGWTEP